VFDDNSARATALLQQASIPLFLTPLLETEISNAFYLRIFRKESTENLMRSSSELFRKDVRAGVFEPKPLSAEVFQQAREIAMRSTAKLGVRTLDLLHVASAIVLEAETFYTFDQNQAKLAKSEGLVVKGSAR
jgi:predicted nucleic acid-binding protein